MIAERSESPASLDDAGALMREAARRQERVVFRGGGTEMAFGYAPEAVGLLLKTTSLDRIVEYSPADMVVEVEGGLTLGALAATLTPHRQRLALDPPQPDVATVGGLLATGTFGPRRARFGTLRDLIVGVTLVRADGARVHGGGKVVKNVAGFDVPKIVVGSLGTLGLIATATFRLHPLPDVTRTLRTFGDCDPVQVRAIVRGLLARQLEPAAVIAFTDCAEGAYDLYVTFEGFARGVEEQLMRFADLVRQHGVACHEVEANEPFVRDANVRTRGVLRLRLAAPPTAFETVHHGTIGPFMRAFSGASVVTYPSLGVTFASTPTAEAAVIRDIVLAMRRSLEAIGGNLVILALDDPDVAQEIDPFGTLPPAFPLMRRLKERFDPERRLNTGRFLGKL